MAIKKVVLTLDDGAIREYESNEAEGLILSDIPELAELVPDAAADNLPVPDETPTASVEAVAPQEVGHRPDAQAEEETPG